MAGQVSELNKKIHRKGAKTLRKKRLCVFAVKYIITLSQDFGSP